MSGDFDILDENFAHLIEEWSDIVKRFKRLAETPRTISERWERRGLIALATASRSPSSNLSIDAQTLYQAALASTRRERDYTSLIQSVSNASDLLRRIHTKFFETDDHDRSPVIMGTSVSLELDDNDLQLATVLTAVDALQRMEEINDDIQDALGRRQDLRRFVPTYQQWSSEAHLPRLDD